MMSKISTTTNVWHSSLINVNTEQEPGIQKHVKFWDKTNKGYITPLDTISGFITLGYGVIFSVAIGTFVGVFLSLSTQTGWIPDPLCRSDVQNLIRAKKQTQSNVGAFDDDGVFVPEKFDRLFDKHAKSDKSGKTITITELVRMTQEQENLGRNIKAWATCVVELSTAYFFIGHRGCLTRDAVRSAYDGSLFYRLKDYRLMIQDKKGIPYTENILKGPYLSKPAGILSTKAVEQGLLSLYSTLQSRSYKVTSDYHLQDWVSYIQDSSKTINNALPRALKRPTSIINGVTTPKPSSYKTNSKIPSDPSELFPDGLTGVAKAECEVAPMGTDFLSSLLHQGSADDSLGTRGLLSSSDMSDDSMDNGRESTIFHHLTSAENDLLTSAATHAASTSHQSMSPNPTASSSTISTNAPLMNGFLREEESDNEWLADGMTGVQHETKKTPKSPANAPVVETAKKTTNKQPQQILTPPPQPDLHHEEDSNAAITPPPEEKPLVELQTSEKSIPAPIDTGNNKTNNKKVKRKNKNKSGPISPISNSDSGQEHIPSNAIPQSPIDVSWSIAADSK